VCLLPWERQDVARVARWMAGKAVGLVLSGGGSRGLAHLGVLHALDDAGVPVDVIGGTSQVCPSCCSPSCCLPRHMLADNLAAQVSRAVSPRQDISVQSKVFDSCTDAQIH
jgi:hypothetical protein